MMRSRLSFVLPVLAAACANASKVTDAPIAEPVFYAKNVKAYGETVSGLPPDIVYAWDLKIEGDHVKWKECTSKEECTTVERTRLKSDLLAVERQTQTTAVNGHDVDVVKLSLRPRPSYVVPSTPEKRTH